MYDPNSVIVYRPPLVISRFDSADYHGPIPWSIRLNPLRYSVTLFPGGPNRLTINRGGRWYIRAANFIFYLRGSNG